MKALLSYGREASTLGSCCTVRSFLPGLRCGRSPLYVSVEPSRLACIS